MSDLTGQAKKLEGWKAIGTHLGVSVRKAQQLEVERGLPVYRSAGQKGRVWARPEELDTWRLRVDAEDAAKPVPEPATTAPYPEPLSQAPARGRRKPVAASVAAVLIAAASLAFWFGSQPGGQPANFTVEGRLLTVWNEHNQVLFTHVFPTIVADHKTLPADWPHAFVTNADGSVNLVVSSILSVICFDRRGHILWEHRPGRRLRTVEGTDLPNDYQVTLVDRLSQPHSNRARILVGANRGPGALFAVELLDANGVKVTEYFHLGWFFGDAVGALSGSKEQIFLAGVDDAVAAVENYSATLVALDPDRPWGQATTLKQNPRVNLADVLPAAELAVLLFPEYPRDPDRNNYGRGSRITPTPDSLEFQIVHSSNALTAWFRFDGRLRLQEILPDVRLLPILQQSILKGVPQARWHSVIQQYMGHIKYVRNEFAERGPAVLSTER